jgi:hypothetical protein
MVYSVGVVCSVFVWGMCMCSVCDVLVCGVYMMCVWCASVYGIQQAVVICKYMVLRTPVEEKLFLLRKHRVQCCTENAWFVFPIMPPNFSFQEI